MSSSNLVAFIIWSGTNVGAGVAATLKENGYKVAVGNRNPTEATDGDYFPVQVDAANKESIFAAFDTVTKALGPVNVVIFNGACPFYVFFPSNESHPTSWYIYSHGVCLSPKGK